jgi:archaemetzincin
MESAPVGGKIYVRPVGPVDDAIVRRLRKELGRYLGTAVEEMAAMEIPEGSFDPKRNQHYSTAILKAVLAEAPAGASRVLGIVDRDLCIPILTFVFGEAQLGGTVALVSLARLRQEFYGLAPDPPLFFDRLRKESLHELGHTFGLIHCRVPDCVMYLSNAIRDVDRKGRELCRSCHETMIAKMEGGRS